MPKTTQQLTQAEETVAAEAVQAVLASDIPGWERAMIPQDTLVKGINAAVAAIDKLRDQLADSQPQTGG